MAEFTHMKGDKVQMVDISGKDDVMREAVAEGRIRPGRRRSARSGKGPW